MTTARATAATAKRRRVVEAFGHAAAAIGAIGPDSNLFIVTRGQFSMLDIVRHVLDELGPAGVSIWTWAIAEYEVDAMCGLIADGRITSARLIVDRSAEQRNVAILDTWRARFGADTVRVCKNHAKIARVWTPARRVLVRGSLNLNFNPRFEQVDLTVDGPDFDLVVAIEDGLPVLPRLAGNLEAEAASGVSQAFELSELPAFRGVKTWAR